MNQKQSTKIWICSFTVFIGMSLACSTTSLSERFTDHSPNINPTRTPLPTFTATAEQAAIVIPTPTETSSPQPVEPTPIPATATSIPVESETESTEAESAGSESGTESEAQVEPTPTETPVPPPTEPPPPPPPTELPPPAGPVVGAHGVLGQITFREGRNTYGIGEKVFVRIEATLPQGGQMSFGILGLTTSTGAFQTSWSSGNINGTFTHEDGLAFNTPGNHKIWLSICFSSEAECQGANGDWERFEPGLDVIIQ